MLENVRRIEITRNCAGKTLAQMDAVIESVFTSMAQQYGVGIVGSRGAYAVTTTPNSVARGIAGTISVENNVLKISCLLPFNLLSAKSVIESEMNACLSAALA